MKRLIPLLLLALVAVSGCAYSESSASEVSVNVEGAIFWPTDPEVNGCTLPEHKDYLGAGDDHKVYLAGLRNYVFDSDEGSDHGPVPLTTSDDATMGLVGYISFRLIAPRNDMSPAAQKAACETLKSFHRLIGSKVYNGHEGYVNGGDFRGWQGLLDQYIGKPLETVVADLGSDNKALDVYKSETVRNDIEKTISANLPTQVRTATDGNLFFQIVDVSLSKPEPPPDLVKALNDGTVAKQENANATLRNATVKTKYDQITECKAKGISEGSCVLIYGINEGNVPLLPQGTGVVLPKQ